MTSEKSGSMPVVSQSIMKPMVPVGASTLAWALRQPFFCTDLEALVCHTSAATCKHVAIQRRAPNAPQSVAAACLRMTRACAAALRA